LAVADLVVHPGTSHVHAFSPTHNDTSLVQGRPIYSLGL
jgi:hypothetical protein